MTVILLRLNHVLTALVVWQGALSCWNIQSLDSFPNIESADGSSLFSSVLVYFAALILPSQKSIFPAPANEKQPQIITVVGFFTVGKSVQGFYASPSTLRTIICPAWLLRQKLDSSLNMIFFHCSLDHLTWAFAQRNRF